MPRVAMGLLVVAFLLPASTFAQGGFPACWRCDTSNGCYILDAPGWASCKSPRGVCVLSGTCGGLRSAAASSVGQEQVDHRTRRWTQATNLLADIGAKASHAGVMIDLLRKEIKDQPIDYKVVFVKKATDIGDVQLLYDYDTSVAVVTEPGKKGPVTRMISFGDSSWRMISTDAVNGSGSFKLDESNDDKLGAVDKPVPAPRSPTAQ
jgi:hypothetical protein